MIRSRPGKGLPQAGRKKRVAAAALRERAPITPPAMLYILVDETGEARQIPGRQMRNPPDIHGELWAAKIGKKHRQVCRYVLGKRMIYRYTFVFNYRQNHRHVANFKDRQSTSAIFLI
ncbi:hypothetical protein GFL85_21720 [Rhizobium laguerreae]|uniref:hypothetical protein n=1 Tax=Rhizobium laguerreae TaxID=1076926 RepID=UPI00143F91AA|nr:hypothetical protein [Rhizobium laguerreae]NKM13604.1 hypothetical protein [Rhizobium laguerreae]